MKKLIANFRLKRKLSDIHWKVKKGFTYVSDQEQYQLREKWVEPVDPLTCTGDCEDFALACRLLTDEAGLKSRLIYCKTETGGGHCVLSVSGFILDNRLTTVRPRDKMNYEWIAMSGYDAGDEWTKIT